MAYARNVMKSNPVTSHAEDTISNAVKIMAEGDFGSLLIVKDGVLEAIFTERDLLKKVVYEGKNPESTLIKEVATFNPVTVKEGTPYRDCAEILKDNRFRHLPVVDDEGKPIGIISSKDFFEHMSGEMENIIIRIKDEGRAIEDDFDLYEEIGLPTSAL
jgi:CBS domain-containing protein